jgi:hypothetical protein
MRLQAIAATILGLTMVSAAAQEVGTGRYAIEPSVDGFIRLDTETGSISHCARRDGVWRCDILAEDRSAIDGLAAEVKALGDRLDDLSARMDALEAGDRAVAPPPEPKTVEPAPGFAELLIQRLFDLVRDMKRGPQTSS